VSVPNPHFGCILNNQDFDLIAKRIEDHQIPWVTRHSLRYSGELVEQKIIFVLDSSNNAIKIKSYSNPEAIFL
jgi:extradiol dioxygenase family protein